jgi:hypothetical protein
MPFPSHPSSFHDPDTIRRRLKIIKLFLSILFCETFIQIQIFFSDQYYEAPRCTILPSRTLTRRSTALIGFY